MNTIPLPTKLAFQESDNPHKKTLILEPLYAGYGLTIGNALRRVLLSSLPGAAVSAIKMSGAEHEFSAVKNVKEDVVDIILNFKNLRLKIHDGDEVRLTLKAKGKKDVTAADIAKDSNVEIMNPDLHLFTITDDKTEVDVEIVAKTGRGFEPTEIREDAEKEVGLINVDSLFSPIRAVGYKVENVRVGQMTNFERVSMEIETDGTVTPEEAVYKSAEILRDHVNVLTPEFFENQGKEELLEVVESENQPSEMEASEEAASE